MKLLPVLILDASLLINFLKVNRVDLIQCYPATIMITEHVRDEVTSAYPDQLARLDQAIADKIFKVLMITNASEIEEIVNFREDKTQRRLGFGECSAIIFAAKQNCSVGIDDGPAIKVIRKEFPNIKVVQTADLVVEAIRKEIITLAEADKLKEIWANLYKFRLKFQSFAELLR